MQLLHNKGGVNETLAVGHDMSLQGFLGCLSCYATYLVGRVHTGRRRSAQAEIDIFKEIIHSFL